MKLAQLDVLRAVAQRLFNRHIKAACGQRIDAPVEANAAAGVQLPIAAPSRSCAVSSAAGKLLLIKFAVLIRHFATNDLPPECFHPIGDTPLLLQLLFACVPR